MMSMVLQKRQKKLTGAGEKLLKLNNLKGNYTNRVATLTKEHKFLVTIGFALLVLRI